MTAELPRKRAASKPIIMGRESTRTDLRGGTEVDERPRKYLTGRELRRQLKRDAIIAAVSGGETQFPEKIMRKMRDGEDVIDPTEPPPFELSRVHLRYIRRYSAMPWIERAQHEAFWQCRACGFRPMPVVVLEIDRKPRLDDSAWAWFSSISRMTRFALVRISSEASRADGIFRRRRFSGKPNVKFNLVSAA